MPGWVELALMPIVIYATFFFLAWILNRNSLSLQSRILGWAAIAVTVASFLWSMWYESLLPYFRSGRYHSALLSVWQVLWMLAGIGMSVNGLKRFLTAWSGVMSQGNPSTGPERTVRRYAAGSHPALKRIRELPTLRERLDAAFRVIRNMLLIPGLGRVSAGVGIAIIGGQILEPDPSLSPDVSLVMFALVLVFVGALQELAARRGDDSGG